MSSDPAHLRTLDLVRATTEHTLLTVLASDARFVARADHALAVFLGADAAPSLMAHDGMSRAQVAELPALLRPVGLAAVVLGGERLRLACLSDDPRAVGLPAGFGPIGPVLGLPIRTEGDVLGGVLLGRCRGASPYGDDDERRVQDLVDVAAVLARRMRRQAATEEMVRRLRLEHGSDRAQVEVEPGEATVIRRLLVEARELLGSEIAAITRVDDDIEVLTHLDDPHDILGVAEGVSWHPSVGLSRLMLDRRIPSAVPDLQAHPTTTRLPFLATFGPRSYVGVPVTLPDGQVVGALSTLGRVPERQVPLAHLYGLRAIATMIGSELDRRRRDRAALTDERDRFRSRLHAGTRAIHLQPIVDLGSSKVTGYEALSRFADAGGHPRPPDQEFEEARRLELGNQLEHEMLAMALGTLPRLPPACYLSVNLSPAALTAPRARDLLACALRRHPGRLVVELTGHERVGDYAELRENLCDLREAGLRLAVDDTGSGYASLQHATRLRPEIIKLDREFVRDLQDPASRAVARAMVGFATDIGADLVAEGIETPRDLAVLRRLGASHGQGYLLGRPGPLDRLDVAPAVDTTVDTAVDTAVHTGTDVDATPVRRFAAG